MKSLARMSRVPLVVLAGALSCVLALPGAAVAADDQGGGGGGGGEPEEDFRPPTITFVKPAGEVDGWYTADTVQVASNITDAESIIASASYSLTGATTADWRTWTPGTTLFLGNQGVTTVHVTAEDGNGNVGQGSVSVRFDRTNPTAAYTGVIRDGAVYGLGAQIPITYACDDAHSGIASCVVNDADGMLDTSTAGHHGLLVTATDRVGRTWAQGMTYTVVDPNFDFRTDARITGDARVGATLTAQRPTAIPVPDSFTYQWRRGGEAIGGATSATYVPTAADLGASLTVDLTAHKPGFNDRSQTTAPVTVAAGQLSLAGGTTPQLVHDGHVVGTTLEVEHPAVQPAAASVSYWWYRDDVLILGANQSTYTTTAADRGHRVRAAVVGTLDGYQQAVWQTAPSPLITAIPLQVTGTPVVTGTPRVGGVLASTVPTFTTGAAGVRVTTKVEWLRDGVPVPGASGPTYTLRGGDAGHRITSRVTGEAIGYEPAARTSAATAPVAKASASVTATPKVKKRGSKRKVRLAVRVTAPGVVPTGAVVVTRGSKVVGRGALRDGGVALRLKGLRTGKTKLVVSYAGDAAVGGASATARVTVR